MNHAISFHLKIFRKSKTTTKSCNRALCDPVWNPESFTYAVINNIFRTVTYITCLQYLLKTNKKSESEKAQQGILVAAEHLPKENKVLSMLNLLLGVKLVTFENRCASFQTAFFSYGGL